MVKLPEPKSTGGNLLKGSDLQNAITMATIEEVRLSDALRNQFIEIDGRLYTPVITLKMGDEYRDLALNKTNYKVLRDALGDDSDNWIGKGIQLIKIKQRNPNTRQLTDAIAVQPMVEAPEQVPKTTKQKRIKE